MLTSNPELPIVWSGGREDPGMKKVAPVLTLALAVTLAALAYAQDNAGSPDLGPPVNVFNQTPLPSGWANPNTGGAGESVNNGVDAEPPLAAAPAAPVDGATTLSQSSGDDNSNATNGNDANGAGWGNSDSNATGGGDNGGSDSTATNGSDTGDSDSSAIGADASAGASEMSNGSGDGDSNASSDSDSDTTSGDSGDNSTDSGGSDTSSSDSADSSGWK